MTTNDEKATLRWESYAIRARRWAKSAAAHRRRIRRLIFLGVLVFCAWARLGWDARAALATIPCLLILATALTLVISKWRKLKGQRPREPY
jgi:hypothetical protein